MVLTSRRSTRWRLQAEIQEPVDLVDRRDHGHKDEFVVAAVGVHLGRPPGRLIARLADGAVDPRTAFG